MKKIVLFLIIVLAFAMVSAIALPNYPAPPKYPDPQFGSNFLPDFWEATQAGTAREPGGALPEVPTEPNQR